jgi:hypothetical protein
MSKIITPEATLSYPHLFEPKIPEGQTEAVYSCALVFGPDADLSEMKKVVETIAKEKFGDKYAALLKAGKLRMPFRADGEDKGYAEGSTFINVKSKQAPGIVSRYAGADGKPAAIKDPAEIYAGAKVRASLRAFAYDNNGNKGVSFALNNIQKLGDGPRIDGRMKAEDEFSAEESSASDLDDLF